jgi:hypothetical protein
MKLNLNRNPEPILPPAKVELSPIQWWAVDTEVKVTPSNGFRQVELVLL